MDKDPIELLRAANPVMSDVPIDTDALITRVMARVSAPAPRPRVLASFKAKMAASVALAATAATAGILALASLGAPVASLSLAAGGTSPSASGATPAMMICEWCLISPYTFVASGLSNAAGNAPVYVLTSPDPTSTAAALVSYLGLTDPTTSTTSPTDGVVEVTSGTTTIDVASTDLGSLYISDQSGLTLPGSPSSSASDLEGALTNLLGLTAPGYQLSDPQVSVTAPDPANSVPGDEYISYSVSVAGNVINNVSISADFNTQGQLLNLTAPLFSVASATNYPLVSPSAGVDSLNAEAAAIRAAQNAQNNTTASTVPTDTTASTVPVVSPPVTISGSGGGTGSGSSGSSPGSPPVSTTSSIPNVTTTSLPAVVTLTSSNLVYDLSALANGQVAAIPVYTYSGTYPDGTAAGPGWAIPALDPSAVTIPSDWTPFQFWAWGHVMPMMLQGTAPSSGGATLTPATAQTTPRP